jgi:hypothetical protein
MDKILVEVYVPASNQEFDVFIPLRSRVYEVITLLSKSIAEITSGYYTQTDTVLCDRLTGNVLKINSTVEEIGLTNGVKLMLL